MLVNGKEVRVVESHEEVLGDWADAARAVGRPLVLVTLDRHLDVAAALRADYVADGLGPANGHAFERWQRRVLARFRGAGAAEVDELTVRLQNDEHIDAALRIGVLRRALIVSSQMGATDDVTVDGAAVYRPVCAPACPLESHDSEACVRARFDSVLEDDVLGPALAHLRFVPAAAYVLDIDLDTFSTRRGLRPRSTQVFHELIRGAALVTLAREPEYVAESLDDHDADEIEAIVLQHVRAACSGTS